MTYETIAPERIVKIKCTIEESITEEVLKYFEYALRSKADKIVIEIDNKRK